MTITNGKRRKINIVRYEQDRIEIYELTQYNIQRTWARHSIALTTRELEAIAKKAPTLRMEKGR